jgi:hypothetical protein
MRQALIAIAAAVIVAAVGGPPALGRGGIVDVRDFKAFDVYYAGHRVLGLDLARADVLPLGDVDRDAEVTADYGKCKSVGGGGCSYELELINSSMCRVYPDFYYSPPSLEPVNGAQGGWIRTAHLYDVYTGRTAVTIFSVSRKEAHHVAKQLRNIRASQRTDQLPAPNKKLLNGKARCQRGVGVPPPPN